MLQRFAHDGFCVQIRVIEQRVGCGVGEIAARADGYKLLIRFDDLTVAGDNQHRILIRNDHQRLQAAHTLIGTPDLRQIDRRSLEISAMLLQLLLEFFCQREGVCHSNPRIRSATVFL